MIEQAAAFPAATALELGEYRQAVASGDEEQIEACAFRLVERICICQADFPT
jgi:hypothetical protein